MIIRFLFSWNKKCMNYNQQKTKFTECKFISYFSLADTRGKCSCCQQKLMLSLYLPVCQQKLILCLYGRKRLWLLKQHSQIVPNHVHRQWTLILRKCPREKIWEHPIKKNGKNLYCLCMRNTIGVLVNWNA